MRPVFPDYLSVSYDYDHIEHRELLLTSLVEGNHHLVRTQNFSKKYNFLTPDKSAYLGVRNNRFSENFAHVTLNISNALF